MHGLFILIIIRNKKPVERFEMLSNIIVIIIVCLAVFFVGWRIYKKITQKSIGCHCDFSDECTECMASEKKQDGVS
jgi:hypothetical protein